MFILFGGIKLITGLIFKLFPPRNINRIYGWRTKLSMKNEETWKEAQRHGANLMILGGLINVVLGLFISVIYENAIADLMGTLGLLDEDEFCLICHK